MALNIDGPKGADRWRERTFEVVTEWDPEARAWSAEVPGLMGAHSWAGDLGALDAAIREAIAGALDLPRGAEPDLKLVRVSAGPGGLADG